MDNYTQFPNDILEAIIARRFSAIQLTAIIYIVRKVNGWGKPCDTISVSKLAKDSGYSRRAMIGAISDLEKMGVISIERQGSGRLSEMAVRDPKYWDKPVNGTSHVNHSSLGTTVHTPVNVASHLPVNGTSQEPVNHGSHTKERNISKYTSQKKETGVHLVLTREQQEELAPDSEGWSW